MSRYCRDEILHQALELAHSPTVIAHDLDGGIIQPNAWTIKWLQNGLDMFHRVYPFAGDITSTALTIRANNTDCVLTSDTTLYLPSDFMLDVRNGVEATFGERSYRLRRVDGQRYLDLKITYQNRATNQVLCYAVLGKRIKTLPLITESQSALLHYYALPAAPGPEDEVDFPDEYTLIEFVRIKILEWTRSQGIPPGTAQDYMRKQLAMLRASGLLNEPEYTSGQLENQQVIPEGMLFNRNAWMGGWV